MRIGIAGFGTIGRKVARALDAGIDGLELCGVTTRSATAAVEALRAFRTPVSVMPIAELAALADVVVECAPKAAFRDLAFPVVQAGKLLITVSGAALLDSPDLVDLARRTGGRVRLATGALLGLDAVRAAAEGTIHSATIVTRKPPRSLADAATVIERGIDLSSIREPVQLFGGTAREGARLFPANVNVAAALGLAGIGPDRTRLEIWADPAVDRNTHTVIVDADSARLEMKIAGVPSEEHPGTARITALSVIACLRSLASPLQIGT